MPLLDRSARPPLGLSIALFVLAFAGGARAATSPVTVEVSFPSAGPQDGFESASVQLRWHLSLCGRTIWIDVQTLADTVQTGSTYWMNGERHEVPSGTPPPRPVNGVDVFGTAYDDGSVVGKFGTLAPAHGLRGGCGSIGDSIADLPEHLRSDDPGAISAYLSNLTIELGIRQPLESGAAEEALRRARREAEQREREARAAAEREEKERKAEEERQQREREREQTTASGGEPDGRPSGSSGSYGEVSRPSEPERPDPAEVQRQRQEQAKREYDAYMERQRLQEEERLRKQREWEEQRRQEEEAMRAVAVAAAPLVTAGINGVGEVVGGINSVVDNWTDLELGCRVVTDFRTGAPGCGLNLRYGGILYINVGGGFFDSPAFEKYQRFGGPGGPVVTVVDASRSRNLYGEIGPGVAIPFNRTFSLRLEGGGYVAYMSLPRSYALSAGSASEDPTGGFFGGGGFNVRLPDSGVAFAFNYRVTTMNYPGLRFGREGVTVGYTPPELAHSFGLAALVRWDHAKAR